MNEELLKIVVEKSEHGGTRTHTWVNGTYVRIQGIEFKQVLGEDAQLTIETQLFEGVFGDE